MEMIYDLDGTVMFKDEQEIVFCIKRGEVEKMEVVGNTLPGLFRIATNKKRGLLVWLGTRVPPSTRIRLQENLDRAGIPYFSPENLLHYNHGNSVTDSFWVKFENGIQTWEELQSWVFGG